MHALFLTIVLIWTSSLSIKDLLFINNMRWIVTVDFILLVGELLKIDVFIIVMDVFVMNST